MLPTPTISQRLSFYIVPFPSKYSTLSSLKFFFILNVHFFLNLPRGFLLHRAYSINCFYSQYCLNIHSSGLKFSYNFGRLVYSCSSLKYLVCYFTVSTSSTGLQIFFHILFSEVLDFLFSVTRYKSFIKFIKSAYLYAVRCT